MPRMQIIHDASTPKTGFRIKNEGRGESADQDGHVGMRVRGKWGTNLGSQAVL